MQKMQINFSGAMARKRQIIVGAFVLVSIASIAGLGYYYYSVVSKQTVEPIDITLAAPDAGLNPAMAPAAPAMNASDVPGAPDAMAQAASGAGPAASATAPGQPMPGPVGAAPANPGNPGVPVNQPVALAAMTAPPVMPAAMQATPATAVTGSGSAAKPVSGGVIAPETTSLSGIVGRPDDSTVRSIGELVRVEVQKAVREAKKEADLAAKAAQAAEPPPPINMTSSGASAPKPPKPAMAKMGKLLVPPEPVNTDIVETLSIIGKVGQEKAEVSFNGVAITVNKNQRAGSYMVNNIDANCVYLTDRFNKPMNSCILR